ncbi:hypothetical protein KCP70_20525 [Salmonella enterica subsp. enterica]|nr:hypothetical protein KCP70_20525 [Salmonella enterica subsp. enterica]
MLSASRLEIISTVAGAKCRPAKVKQMVLAQSFSPSRMALLDEEGQGWGSDVHSAAPM